MMLKPRTLRMGYMGDGEAARAPVLCLGVQGLRSRVMQSVRGAGWGVARVNYRRPMDLYLLKPSDDETDDEIRRSESNVLGYLGFMHGYGFQTLNVICRELHDWGIRSLLFFGYGGHTFEAQKGEWCWIAQGLHQVAPMNKNDRFSNWMEPYQPLAGAPFGLIDAKCISLWSPYDASVAQAYHPVMVDMECGWLFKISHEIKIKCGAMLMTYDYLGDAEYAHRIHNAVRPDTYTRLLTVFKSVFSHQTV